MTPRLGSAMFDLATSIVAYLALTAVMFVATRVSYLLVLVLAVPAAGFLLRTYIVFHDCAHGSFLPLEAREPLLGRRHRAFVFTPFRGWRHNHAVHHATAGDLDRRGVGDVPTLTVAEYRARPCVGPPRLPAVPQPAGDVRARAAVGRCCIGPRLVRPRMRAAASAAACSRTDLALVVRHRRALLGSSAGATFLLVQGPPVLIAGAAGIWLFYVQHQFEDTYWERNERVELRRRRAARAAPT